MFEFPRVFNRIPFISLHRSSKEIVFGYGAYSITFGVFMDNDGVFVQWLR